MSEREPWMPTIAEMAEVAKRYRSHKVEAIIRRAARLRAIEELEKVRGRAASTINDRIAQLRAEEERSNDHG